MEKICPHCGAALHADASFCPRCAQSVNQREQLRPPRPVPRRTLRGGLAVLLLAALVLGGWLYTRPKTFDNGTAEVIYTDGDGTYQLLLNYWGDRFQSMSDYSEEVEEATQSNKPSCLYINYVDSGVNAKEAFLRKVKWGDVEFVQGEDSPEPWQCTHPSAQNYKPEAALVSILSYTDRSGDMELRWTIRMKNGDTIRLYQRMELGVVPTRHFYPEDVPMDTMEDLQALVDEVNETIPANIIVYLHLPVVTYEGSLVLEKRTMNLVGSQSPDGVRTTFTSTIQATAQDGYICQFTNLDVVGEDGGIGVSATARINFRDCHISGWRTGILSYGNSWVNAKDCIFANNVVGLHFNATGTNSNDHMYSDNLFQNNNTALLLENVPSDQTLYLEGTRFSGNSTDIDNRCGQELDISEAIFK